MMPMPPQPQGPPQEPPPQEGDTLTVEQGDTWESIAAMLGIAPEELMSANPGVQVLEPGMTLNMPPVGGQSAPLPPFQGEMAPGGQMPPGGPLPPFQGGGPGGPGGGMPPGMMQMLMGGRR